MKWVLAVPLAVAACASPEATRVRGDGPGADVGNLGRVVVIHEGARPYYDTRCVSEVPCSGPRPAVGAR
jgi:hypothetical protein